MRYFQIYILTIMLLTISIFAVQAQTQGNTTQGQFFNNSGNAQTNNSLSNTGQSNSTFGRGNQNSTFGNGSQMNGQSGDQNRTPRRTSRRGESQTTGTGASDLQGARNRPARPTRPGPSEGNPPESTDTGVSVMQSSASSETPVNRQTLAPRPKLRRVATIYLDARNQTVALNQPFTVDVKVSVPEEMAFDKLAFTLRYSPEDLLPIEGIDSKKQWIPARTVQTLPEGGGDEAPSPDVGKTSKLAPAGFLLAGAAGKTSVIANGIDPKAGMIQFAADTPNASRTGISVIARLTFVPLRETKETRIEFIFADPKIAIDRDLPLTFLHKNDQDVLGTSSNPQDGVIPLDLAIISSIAAELTERTDERETQERTVTLQLVPRQQEADTGDEIEVDVVLSNPEKKTIDRVDLLVLYNPRVLEALDASPALPGVNIDGRSYKKQFPFDYPMLNIVDTGKGIIDYRQRAVKNSIRSDGVLATIHFHALRPTKKTTLRLLVNETGEVPTTGVSFRNEDRLGNPEDPFDGFQTTSLTVQATTAYLQEYLENAGS